MDLPHLDGAARTVALAAAALEVVLVVGEAVVLVVAVADRVEAAEVLAGD